jgi:hypothetical protein
MTWGDVAPQSQSCTGARHLAIEKVDSGNADRL